MGCCGRWETGAVVRCSTHRIAGSMPRAAAYRACRRPENKGRGNRRGRECGSRVENLRTGFAGLRKKPGPRKPRPAMETVDISGYYQKYWCRKYRSQWAARGWFGSRQFQFACVHFLLRKRKRTKRNRPRPGALRAALRFSQPAGPVELACAQTATGPLSPAAAMLGPGRRDINRRPQQAIEIRLSSSKNPHLRGLAFRRS